jgi:hypothetical protein
MDIKCRCLFEILLTVVDVRCADILCVVVSYLFFVSLLYSTITVQGILRGAFKSNRDFQFYRYKKGC